MLRSSITDLPAELILKILNFLDLATLINSASISRQFKSLQRDHALWKRKLKRHFPHRHASLDQTPNVDWYKECHQCFVTEYSALSDDVRQLFSAVKDNDLETIMQQPLPLKYLITKDSKQVSLATWAYHNQKILDYFYQIATIYHSNADKLTLDTRKKDHQEHTILYWALLCRQPQQHINLLILQGCDINETYFGKESPILLAAELGLHETLTHLLDKNIALLEQADDFGQTPLLWAISKGHTQIVRELIKRGANVNVKTKDGETPLRLAVINGETAIVDLLLNAQTTIENILDEISQPLINRAACDGNLEIFKLLITKKPELLEETDAFGQTPLLWACTKNQYHIALYCLRRGASMHVKSICPGQEGHGKTILHYAAEKGNAEIIVLLLKFGSPISALEPSKQHPIHSAASNGHTAVLKVLLANNNQLLEQANAKGETLLILAAAGGHYEAVAYLLSLHANVEALTYWQPEYADYSKTALYRAAEYGHYQVVSLLLQAGACVTKVAGGEKNLSSHVAASNGRLKALIILLEAHPSLLERPDKTGRTLLILAAQNGYTHMVQYLIYKKANLNAAIHKSNEMDSDNTALDCAIENGHDDVVILLLKAGATVKPNTSLPYNIKSPEASKLLSLEYYRVNRLEGDEYLKSVSMFGVTQNFGAAKQRKLEAVNVLKSVYFFGKNALPLADYEYELNNGELSVVYQRLKNKA